MLSTFVAPILAQLLDDPEIHGVAITPLPWMRELAVLAISFLSSTDDRVLTALEKVALPDEPVVDEDDERVGETHAALWALADMALVEAATGKPLAGPTRGRLARIRRVFVEVAKRRPTGPVERALAYGLVCVEHLGIDDAGDADADDRVAVREAIKRLRAEDGDRTVMAIVGKADDDESRPPIWRALGF